MYKLISVFRSGHKNTSRGVLGGATGWTRVRTVLQGDADIDPERTRGTLILGKNDILLGLVGSLLRPDPHHHSRVTTFSVVCF